MTCSLQCRPQHYSILFCPVVVNAMRNARVANRIEMHFLEVLLDSQQLSEGGREGTLGWGYLAYMQYFIAIILSQKFTIILMEFLFDICLVDFLQNI